MVKIQIRMNIRMRTFITITFFISVAIGIFINNVRQRIHIISVLESNGCRIWFQDEYTFRVNQISDGVIAKKDVKNQRDHFPYGLIHNYFKTCEVIHVDPSEFMNSKYEGEMPEIPDQILQLIGNFKEIKVLRFDNIGGLHKGRLRFLKKLNNLVKLTINQTDINSDELKYLEGNASLQILSITGIDNADNSLNYICNIPNLKWLEIKDDDRGVTDAGITKLKYLRKLSGLYIPLSEISDKGILSITNNFKISLLYVNGKGITNSGIRLLGKLKTINHLYIRSPNINDDTLILLSKGNPNIQSLLLFQANLSDRSIPYIIHMKELTDIQLNSRDEPNEIGFTDEGLLRLIVLKKLRRLSISYAKNLTNNGINTYKMFMPGVEFNNDR